MKLTIDVTAAEHFAMEIVSSDPVEWLTNQVKARARKALSVAKSSPGWTDAAVALASDGGDAQDESAVLLKGKELGLFKTAVQAAEEQRVADDTSVEAPSNTPTAAHVQQQAILRKMALVGAANAQELNAIITAGTQDAVRLMRKERNAPLEGSDAARAVELEKVDEVLQAIDAAAVEISADVAAGRIASLAEIANDARWPG